MSGIGKVFERISEHETLEMPEGNPSGYGMKLTDEEVRDAVDAIKRRRADAESWYRDNGCDLCNVWAYKRKLSGVTHFTADEIEEKLEDAKREFVIRVLMEYTPLDEPVDIREQELTPAPERKGFVAVEWGGTRIG